MTPEVVLKALALGVASAVFAGVLPALRATGSSPQRTLQAAAGGLGGFRFGRVTGALIIVEVGLGVGALFAAGMSYRMFSAIDQETSVAMQTSPRSGRVDRRAVPRSGRERIAAAPTRPGSPASRRRRKALARRLAGQPGVRSWAFSDATPRGRTIRETRTFRGRRFFLGLPGAPGGHVPCRAGLLRHARHRTPLRTDVRAWRRPGRGRSAPDPGPREHEVPRPPGHAVPQARWGRRCASRIRERRPAARGWRSLAWCPTWRRAWGGPSSTAHRWPTCRPSREACIPSRW